MTAQQGSEVLLKVGDAGDPEVFTIVGGLQNTDISLNTQTIDVTNVSSGGWRELLSGGGLNEVTISSRGNFTDSSSESLVLTTAFSRLVRNYEVHFGNGDVLSGAFQISSYNRSGTIKGEEEFALTLESSSPIIYTEA